MNTNRRRVLGAMVGAAALSSRAWSFASDPPTITRPRATDGDQRYEPDWAERLTILVGQDRGDLIGRDDRVIQAALDYVSRLGGGTVEVLPGRYVLRNAIVLPSHVRLLGHGAETVLTKIPSENSALSEDSDWYDQEVTLSDAKSFRVGDGVVFRAKNPHHGGETVIKRTLVARDGNRFKLNDGLRENLWITGKPSCASLFPLLTSERHSDITIENIALDGNRENNENFNGNYGGCIFLQDCARITMRQVTARNYNGDGISFQICHDVLVEDCHSHDNADLGLHPGSGSQRPILRKNRLERNSQGIFWCWGVKFGLAEDNQIDDNRLYGISIGHNDTDNLMRNNLIRNSGVYGLLFRDESQGKDFWANRNVIDSNRFEDSGGEEGVAIQVTGKTHDIQLVRNTIHESRSRARRIGIQLDAQVGAVRLSENRYEGVAIEVADHRAS